MQRQLPMRLAVVVTLLALLPAAVALARPPKMGETVQGVVTLVDLDSDPKHVTIRQDDGGVVDIRIGPNTKIRIEEAAKKSNLAPQADSLRRGQTIRTQFGGGHYAKVIEIVLVPAGGIKR